jgi:hypothetical protein
LELWKNWWDYRNGNQPERRMKVNTNIFGWFKLLFFAAGAFYLWRSALRTHDGEPQKKRDRSLRLVGAVLLSIVVIYFLGYGLGLYSK